MIPSSAVVVPISQYQHVSRSVMYNLRTRETILLGPQADVYFNPDSPRSETIDHKQREVGEEAPAASFAASCATLSFCLHRSRRGRRGACQSRHESRLE